jgi:hypothetical protein
MFFVTPCKVFSSINLLFARIVNSAVRCYFPQWGKNIQEGQKAGNVGQGVFLRRAVEN